MTKMKTSLTRINGRLKLKVRMRTRVASGSICGAGLHPVLIRFATCTLLCDLLFWAAYARIGLMNQVLGSRWAPVPASKQSRYVTSRGQTSVCTGRVQMRLRNLPREQRGIRTARIEARGDSSPTVRSHKIRKNHGLEQAAATSR